MSSALRKKAPAEKLKQALISYPLIFPGECGMISPYCKELEDTV